MNPVPKSVDELVDQIECLSAEARAQLLERITIPTRGRRTPGYTPSCYEAQRILADIPGSMGDEVVADRVDRC